jgi:hypothetical protein
MAARKNVAADEVVKALEAGETYAVVAERFGCSKPRICHIARKAGFDAKASLKARREQSRAAKLIASPPPAPIETRPPELVGLPTDVPPWAALAGLAVDYRDDAREFGDDYAARRCRKLLADLRQQEALDARLGRAA